MAEWQDRYWNSSDGLRLHYRDYAGPAEQPPILCLPGLTRNARDFEPVADRLAGAWRVIADAVFFGTSLGGLVTMLMSGSDPERIAGAMINDIGPVVEPAAIERLRTYVGKGGRWTSWTDAALAAAAINRIAFPHYTAEDWDRFVRRLCSERADGSIQPDYDMAIAKPFATDSGAPDFDPWPLLEGLVDKPVLIVRGETSDLFSAQTADRMLDALPKAELVTVPGIGHAPVLDEPEAVAGIDRLLERVLAEAELEPSRPTAA